VVQLRGSGLKIIARNDVLLKHIQGIKLNHLFWDYRRIWAYLNYHIHIHVNRKRIYRVMQVNHLLIKDRTLLRAKQ
jgi:putative transposase